MAKRRKLENSEEEQQKQQLACQDKVKNSPIINTSERLDNCIATVNDHHEEEKNKNSTSLLALDNSKDEKINHVENQSAAILIKEEKNNNCNTSSGSEEKEQMENNSNTCRDELSACEKEGEENKQFFWNEVVENLNLDQLLKLEEIIKEKQSKVVKLADKILEDRPLRLCSWVDTDEEGDKS